MDHRRRLRDWSNLPSELVEEIILKIDWPEDVIRFSSVCREWLTTFKRVRPMWRPLNPWLLLCENTKDNEECLRKVYNPGNDRQYRLKLPQTFGKNCWGSDYGWIVTYGLDLELTLFNPLTKSSLLLPPTASMTPEDLIGVHCGNNCKYKPYWMRQDHILKACVLKTNENENDGRLLVAVIHTNQRYYGHVSSTYLSFAKPEDTRWTLIETPQEMMIHDVLFSKDLLWFVDDKSRLWYVDLNKGGPSFKARELMVERHRLLDQQPIKYLVKSSDHQLYLVQRFCWTEDTPPKTTITRTKNGILIVDDGNDDICELNDAQITNRKSELTYTHEFQIFKLDLGSKQWKFLDDFPSEWGQSSVFLGKNTALVVAAPKANTCESRHIYYAGDDHEHTSGHDIGVRNVCSNLPPYSIPTEVAPSDDIVGHVCNPFWFTPLFS